MSCAMSLENTQDAAMPELAITGTHGEWNILLAAPL